MNNVKTNATEVAKFTKLVIAMVGHKQMGVLGRVPYYFTRRAARRHLVSMWGKTVPEEFKHIWEATVKLYEDNLSLD